MLTAIVGSFKALLEHADFDDGADQDTDPYRSIDSGGEVDGADTRPVLGQGDETALPDGLNIGYTINLHLPATSDIAVFNAIFKSLRENLLR